MSDRRRSALILAVLAVLVLVALLHGPDPRDSKPGSYLGRSGVVWMEVRW